MSDDLTTILTIHGSDVARVDDTTYLLLSAIYAVADGGAPIFYCVERDWLTMPAAKMAVLLRVNAELMAERDAQAARIAQLESQLAAPKETPVKNQERMFHAQAAALDADAPPVSCPDCPATFKNARALQMHRQRAHQGMQTPAQSRAADDQGWHCAAKGCTGAFARDMHDTDFCTQHAQRPNGVETAA